MWIYEQQNGRIRRNAEPVLESGYSGSPEAVNNPTKQDIISVGPIPVGLYRIGNAYSSETFGPCVMALEPDKGNEMHGRSGFLIHGDNARRNRSASRGCIILGPRARQAISKSTDRWLVVVRSLD